MRLALISLGYGAFNGDAQKYKCTFAFSFNTLDEFKTRFLKRFGNFQMSRKLEKRRLDIKQMTYDAKSIDGWEETINKLTPLRVKVKIEHRYL